MTVMSSWKWRLTFLSIFLKSEYLISLFLAASWSAAFTSLFALPCNKAMSLLLRGTKHVSSLVLSHASYNTT
ncbi:unnamed protein product [Linum trigynum]|uniref:Secreted protein n=1 Tax=Linum trigynum TaxID=586398 RepID=A0AAV2FHF1_9ROSI